jgi:hypothetical protein
MAHEFKIMNTSGTITTYTDYDSIPIDSTLKHVISFKPDLGTEVESFEMVLENDFDDSAFSNKFITEDDYGLDHPTLAGQAITGGGDTLVLDGTDGSSTNAGDKILPEHNTVGLHKIVPEDWTTGSENHLVFEDMTSLGGTAHYHPPLDEPHSASDGHAASNHRENDLWNYRLSLLVAQENTNNA